MRRLIRLAIDPSWRSSRRRTRGRPRAGWTRRMSVSASPPVVLVPRRLSIARRSRSIPRSKGRLLDLPASCALPDLGELEGRPSWARARVGYNASGLGVAFEVVDKAGPISPEPGRSVGVDGVQVWIDTRDTRNVHRATRFCHRFVASIVPGQGPVARGRGRPEADRPGRRRRPDRRARARSRPGPSGPSRAGGSNSSSRPSRSTASIPRPTVGSGSTIR